MHSESPGSFADIYVRVDKLSQQVATLAEHVADAYQLMARTIANVNDVSLRQSQLSDALGKLTELLANRPPR